MVTAETPSIMHLYRRYFDLIDSGRRPSTSASGTRSCTTLPPANASGTHVTGTAAGTGCTWAIRGVDQPKHCIKVRVPEPS